MFDSAGGRFGQRWLWSVAPECCAGQWSLVSLKMGVSFGRIVWEHGRAQGPAPTQGRGPFRAWRRVGGTRSGRRRGGDHSGALGWARYWNSGHPFRMAGSIFASRLRSVRMSMVTIRPSTTVKASSDASWPSMSAMAPGAPLTVAR